MKKETLKEYIGKWRGIRLSSRSSDRMQEDLLGYARFHNAREDVRVAYSARSMLQVLSGTSLITNIHKISLSRMTALLLIALMIGGGTSYAAEGAVPGDALYSVKTEVNENIKSALAISDTAEAKLQAKLTEERLREAETLAARGKLSADIAADLGARVKTHYEEASSRSAEAKARGDIESSASLEASLEGTMRNSIEILSDLNARIEGNNGNSLISEVRTRADAAAHAQATATVGVTVALETQVGHVVDRAENFLAKTNAKLEKLEGTVEAEVYAEAEARMSEAVSAHAEAEAKLEAKLYVEAYAKAQEAIRIASEALARVESEKRLEVQVKGKERGLINIDSNINARSTTSVQSENGQNNRGSRSIEAEADADAAIDTDVIDVRAVGETKIRTGL